MNIILDMTGILISAFICFSLASLWFSPALFGTLWRSQLAKNGTDVNVPDELKTFIVVFISLVVFATVINVVNVTLNVSGMKEGIGVGIVVWLLVTSAHAAIHFAFERRPIILFGIYSSYYLSASVIISALLSMRR